MHLQILLAGFGDVFVSLTEEFFVYIRVSINGIIQIDQCFRCATFLEKFRAGAMEFVIGFDAFDESDPTWSNNANT
jgi:hypothetical protein